MGAGITFDELERVLREGDAAARYEAIERVQVRDSRGRVLEGQMLDPKVLGLLARALDDGGAHRVMMVEYLYVHHEDLPIRDLAAEKWKPLGRAAVLPVAERCLNGGGGWARRVLYELVTDHLAALDDRELAAVQGVVDAGHDPRLRRLLEVALARRRGDSAPHDVLDAFRHALQDGNRAEREDAIRELGLHRGSREAALLLLGRAHEREAARAFRAVGPALLPEDLPQLLARIESGGHADVLRAAAEYDDPGVADVLFRRIETGDMDAGLAFAALPTAGAPFRARLLAMLLSDGPSTRAAWWALDSLRRPSDVEVAWLCERLAERLDSLGALRQHGHLVSALGPRAAPLTAALDDLLAEADSLRERMWVASVLAGLDFERARPTIEEALGDRQLRHLALRAIERAGPAARASRDALERLHARSVGLEKKRLTRVLHALE